MNPIEGRSTNQGREFLLGAVMAKVFIRTRILCMNISPKDGCSTVVL